MPPSLLLTALIAAVCLPALCCAAAAAEITPVFPGAEWNPLEPEEAGLDRPTLDEMAGYLQGRGCVTRYGYMTYTWGDHTGRGDVASAAKPWYSTMLFIAVESGRLPSLDEKALEWEPRLAEINPALGHKDAGITFRHFANQTSCYGVSERPGEAYDYNDYQMALFWDTLFLKVYGTTYDNVDDEVLHPLLSDKIQAQDEPTMMVFGREDRPGRVGVSPRDFCRFGLLYLNEGDWNGKQVISREHARMAVGDPLPYSIPRTKALEAQMIPGQRSIGSKIIPDDHNDHDGCYSWLWWVNGVQRDGRRKWPDAPNEVWACLGHQNGKRGMAVIPSLQIVFSWNDTTLDERPGQPHPLNPALKLLVQAAAP